MAKKIVFCADGTWEHPNDPGSAMPADTNVYKLYKALLTSSTQSPYYDDGVGVGGNIITHLLGGTMGEGLFQKIRDGYTSVSHVYGDGDQIFLFGFSRGAYTARALAGMIAICGIPQQSRFSPKSVTDAFDAYRCTVSDQRDQLLANLVANYGNRAATITTVGVWDTVGALGIPGILFAGLNEAKYGFLNTSLSPVIKTAFQALSIDERRREFVPTLWQRSPSAPDSQVIEQVWFSGVHCDVGGGYAETGLSDIAMGWMFSKILSLPPESRLELDPIAAAPYQLPLPAKNSLGVLHDSWSLIYGFPKSRSVPAASCLGNSVQIRIKELASYRPPSLKIAANDQLDGYQLLPVVADS